MNLSDIKQLVAGGESRTLEFKRKVNFPEKVIREMVAFANTIGGNLLVGVEDNGSIPGLRNPDEHDFALKKAIQELCVPKIKYKMELIPISEKKSILCYSVEPANRKPFYAKEKVIDRYGKAYVRVADKTLKASREMTQILRRTRTKKDFSFHYGDKEAVLMKLLDSDKNTTLSQFKEAANISTRTASSTLILLVLAGVLQIIPSEKTDFYHLKNF